MTTWTVWTTISILILTVGSVAVFAWFLRDLLRLREQILSEERGERSAEAGRGEGSG